MSEPASALAPDTWPELRDEDGAISEVFLDRVERLLAADDAAALREVVGDLHEADAASLIEALAEDARAPLFRLVGPEHLHYSVLTELDEKIRKAIVDRLSPTLLAEGLRELDSDDAVYILEDLDAEHVAEILQLLPAPERLTLQRSLALPEETAGRRMQAEFIAIPPFWTVGALIDHLREADDLPETFYEVFVVDPAFRPVGTVALDRLLRTRRSVKVTDILNDDVHPIRTTDDQEEVARVFERYNLVSVPVVNEFGRLVGVMTVDDVVDVIQEEADEDLKALGGIVGPEELSDSVARAARSRAPWLLVNSCTAFLSASVIAAFDDTISHMVTLAVLMPIVASMGGNAGTQSLTVSVRALATRELGAHNVRRVLTREVLVGLVNGLLVAAIVGAVAAVWFSLPQVGAIMAAALVANMLVAASFGVLIPVTLGRLGADPAVSSGVFLTMMTDMCGYFAFLGLATWLLRIG